MCNILELVGLFVSPWDLKSFSVPGDTDKIAGLRFNRGSDTQANTMHPDKLGNLFLSNILNLQQFDEFVILATKYQPAMTCSKLTIETLQQGELNCLCVIVDRRKAFSPISSRDHCQRSSPSQISNTPPKGFEPAQNLVQFRFS